MPDDHGPCFKEHTADDAARGARAARRRRAARPPAAGGGHAEGRPRARRRCPRCRGACSTASARRPTIPRLDAASRRPSRRRTASPSTCSAARATAPFEAVRIPLLHRPGDEKYVVCVSLAGRLRHGLRLLRHRPHGLPPQPRRLGDRRSGDAGPRRLAAPGARRRVHGHGRADAQLRPRHARLRGDVRPVRPGHRGPRRSPSRPSASCRRSAASPPRSGRTG